MTVKEKALNRVRELLNYEYVDFGNIGISCGSRNEIIKIINLDTDEKIILYSVEKRDEKFNELYGLITLAWQIELNEKDIEKILNKNS